mmetsp:Transcript_57768/g.79322  ORF Transcript_57768/g.79322 Transcript_57768/m.79322 type:complete len:91 (+) Transcript_57768:135-407(+)
MTMICCVLVPMLMETINNKRKRFEIAERLKESTFSALVNVYDSSCAICLEEYDSNSQVTQLNCNHVFHTECIKEWAKTNNICPYCRTVIQ